MGHTCRTLLSDTLVVHSCGHSCRTLLSDTLAGHSCRLKSPKVVAPKVTRQVCKTSILYDHFVRDFFQNSLVKYCQVSKTSVSRETSSNTHTSSLQSERFERDFFQNSLVKSPKRAFRARHPQKLTLQVCKASVSSKIYWSSLQNERFTRDIL